MPEGVVQRETAVEYFKELVEGALAHQRVDADPMTAFYVVHLLASFVDRLDASEPVALELARAMDAGGEAQRAALREIGDRSLFLSGFFSDSLRRRLIDVDYYVSVGGFAYNTLVRQTRDNLTSVYAELGEKFTAFVDVLAEVSERSACTSNTDLLRLYERWLRTGSRRSAQLLAERGVVPLAGARTGCVQ
jgi:hypothetical protein